MLRHDCAFLRVSFIHRYFQVEKMSDYNPARHEKKMPPAFLLVVSLSSQQLHNVMLILACTILLAANWSMTGSTTTVSNGIITPVTAVCDTSSWAMTKEEAKLLPSIPTENEKISRFSAWMWYLKAREGFVPAEYRCPAGKRTIGYGHNVDALGHTEETADGVVTYTEASGVLYDDIKKQFEQVQRLLPHLNNDQARAVTSLAANCGLAKIMYVGGNPKKGYSAFWLALKRGKTPNFGVYTKYRTPSGTVVQSPNLVSARNFEKLLFTGAGSTNILVGFRNKKPVYKRMSIEQAAEFFRQTLLIS